jgi:hypothetical protein
VGCVTKSLTFLQVGGALYRVLERAYKGYSKRAAAFKDHMALFDLHLGTELPSDFLMRELFRNRSVLEAVQEDQVARYTRMLSMRRKPSFLLLLR